MVDANFRTAQAAEIFLSVIGASAVKAVSFLMIDSLHFKPFMQAIPRRGFISMHNSALSNASANEGCGLALGAEYGGDGISTTFPDDDNDFTFAILIASISAV